MGRAKGSARKSARSEAVRVADLVGADIGVVADDVRARHGRDAEQAPGDGDGRLQHAVELEIGLHVTFGEGEAALADLLRVVPPVPGHDVVVPALLADELGDGGLLAAGLGAGAFPDLHQERVHRLRRLGHGVVEAVGGVAGVAEKAGGLGPEREHLLDDRSIVGLPAALAARDPGLEGPLAEIPAGGEGEEGLDQRSVERHGEAARRLPALGLGGHGSGEVLRQAIEVAAVEEEHEALLVGENVLSEGGAQGGQPFADGGQPLLVGARQLGAGMDEPLPVALQDARLLHRQAEAGAPFPEPVDPREEGDVHPDLRMVPGELRPDLPLQRADGVVGVRAGPVPEERGDARETLAGHLQGRDRVGEGRRLRVPGDRVHFRFVLGEEALEGRGEVLVADRREGRQSVRAVPGGERGIRRKGSVHQGDPVLRPPRGR